MPKQRDSESDAPPFTQEQLEQVKRMLAEMNIQLWQHCPGYVIYCYDCQEKHDWPEYRVNSAIHETTGPLPRYGAFNGPCDICSKRGVHKMVPITHMLEILKISEALSLIRRFLNENTVDVVDKLESDEIEKKLEELEALCVRARFTEFPKDSVLLGQEILSFCVFSGLGMVLPYTTFLIDKLLGGKEEVEKRLKPHEDWVTGRFDCRCGKHVKYSVINPSIIRKNQGEAAREYGVVCSEDVQPEQ